MPVSSYVQCWDGECSPSWRRTPKGSTSSPLRWPTPKHPAHLPEILTRRDIASQRAITHLVEQALGRLPVLVTPMPHEVYAHLEPEARRRLVGRDEADWPILALALRLGCPIWTEDQDFLGSGIPTWTTDRVEIYLASEVLP